MNYINSFELNGSAYIGQGFNYYSDNSNTDTIKWTSQHSIGYSNIYLGDIYASEGASVSSNIIMGTTICESGTYEGNIAISGPVHFNGSSVMSNICIGPCAVNSAHSNVFLSGGMANGCLGVTFVGGSYDRVYTPNARTFVGASNFYYDSYINTLEGSQATIIASTPGDKTALFRISVYDTYTSILYWTAIAWCTSSFISNDNLYSSGRYSGVGYNINNTGGQSRYIVYDGSSYITRATAGVSPSLYNPDTLIYLRDINTAPDNSSRNGPFLLCLGNRYSSSSASNILVHINQIVIDY